VKKIRVCIYSLTGCEGCSLKLINTLMEYSELANIIDIHGHLIDSDDVIECDIAFIDGAIATEHDLSLVREIREKSRIVVALGSCANFLGVIAIANHVSIEKSVYSVYGRPLYIKLENIYMPVDRVIRVDYYIPGCPPIEEEIYTFITSIIIGKSFSLPDSPVCHECKALGLPCMLKKGKPCLGFITRSGCNALCIRYGMSCWGCRGVVDEHSIEKTITTFKEHGISLKDLRDLIEIYLLNTPLGKTLARKEVQNHEHTHT